MIISWNTTRQCNLACKHCYRDAGKRDVRELTTDEGKKLLSEIARSGFRIMVFSGGEPLLRDDIYELAAYARQLGMRPVLGSNGTLIDAEAARRIKESGISRVGISLHSSTPEFHDQFHGSPGSWQGAIDGMMRLREAGVEFQIHTVVTEHNWEEAEKVTDLAVELGAKAHHVFFLVPTGRARSIEEEVPSARLYEQVTRTVLKKQREVDIEVKPTCAPQFMRIAKQMGLQMRFTKGCLAGTSYCCVTPNGDVNPCPYLYLKVGNVLERPFDEIWRTAEVFRTLREGKLGGWCGECDYQDICGGCRARAYYHTGGDYMAQDNWCLYRGGRAAREAVAREASPDNLCTGAAAGGAGAAGAGGKAAAFSTPSAQGGASPEGCSACAETSECLGADAPLGGTVT